MEKFAGNWKCDMVENFEEFLKEVGVGLPKRKVAGLLKPDLKVAVDGNHFIFEMESTFVSKKIEFDLDVEFEDDTPDGRHVKSVVTKVSDTHLRQQEKGEIAATVDRFLEGDILVITAECNGVKGIRKFSRA